MLGCFEAENRAALRIDPGHDMANRAILARAIRTLENQQQRLAAGCVVKALHFSQ